MASERVAVFTGGKQMSVVSGGPSGHMIEQSIPIGRHGKEYVIPIMPLQTQVHWTAITIQPSTQLTSSDFKAVDTTFHGAGDVIQEKTGAATSVKISGTNSFYMVFSTTL